MGISANAQSLLQEHLDKRVDAFKKAQDIADKAKTEKRDMNAEELTEFERWKTDADNHHAAYKKGLDKQRNDEWLENTKKDLDNPAGGRVTSPGAHGGGKTKREAKDFSWNPMENASPQFRQRHNKREIISSNIRSTEDYNAAFNRYLKTGNPAAFQKAGLKPSAYQAGYDPQNGMRSDDEERGGYFIASEEFMSGILKAVDDATFVQKLARVIFVRGARSTGLRKRTAKFNAWNWGSELHDVTTNMDSSLRYGKRSLTPHYITGSCRISKDLIRSAVMPIESMVMEEAQLNLSEVLEAAYLYANGVQRPLGLMVPSSEGIPTTRDVRAIDADVNVTGGQDSTTHWGFDTLIRAKYALKPQYRGRARWMFHRDAVARIAMIKDSSGQYIWQPSKIIGDPDTVLGLPMDESEWMPNTFSADNYFGLLADWSMYYIAIGMEMEMQKLVEMRARTNEYEYLMRMKVDAMPMIDEAFCRLQFAAS